MSMQRRLACALAIAVSGCGGSVLPGGETCGHGTHDDAGQCVPDDSPQNTSPTSCGPGTIRDGNECVGWTPAGADASVDTGTGDAVGDADGGLNVEVACLVSDNIFVIAGDAYIHGGPPLTIEGGTGWIVEVSKSVGGLPSFVTIRVGGNWEAVFSSDSTGKPLVPGTYVDVQRAAFTDPNHPGLDVSGNGNGCNRITGQFRVIEMSGTTTDAGLARLTSFTATYEQHCEGSPQVNVGCVHITQ